MSFASDPKHQTMQPCDELHPLSIYEKDPILTSLLAQEDDLALKIDTLIEEINALEPSVQESSYDSPVSVLPLPAQIAAVRTDSVTTISASDEQGIPLFVEN